LALLFSLSNLFAQTAAITPIRTDVSGFSFWTDTSVTGTTYLQLLSATSKTITPTMDFTNFTSPTLNFKIRTFGGLTGSSSVVTVSISTNNGTSWTTLGTRAGASSTLAAATQFSLSSYSGTQIKIKFESLSATGTIGLGIDDISINGTAACNAPTTQATFGSATTSYSIMTQNFNVGNGTGRLVLMNTTSNFTDPTNGTTYTANTAYSGSGQQVVFAGTTGTSVSLTNLTNTTTYYFAIYEYNCSGSTIKYNQTENTTWATTGLGGCTTGTLTPQATFTPAGTGADEVVDSVAWAGYYSNVTIQANKKYVFKSSNANDYITITEQASSVILASGNTPLTWQSGASSGTMKYFLHANAVCGSQIANRVKTIQVVTTPCSTAVPTASAQSFCAAATAANLVATGTSLRWYSVASGGTVLSPQTALSTGTYYVTQTNGCESDRLAVSVTVSSTVSPTFTQVAAICSGNSLSALPTTSNNGVTGTWSPALNNTATTTYTFTPTAGLCANTATMTITVNTTFVTPTFTQVAAICPGASLSALPTTSNNGYTGTWSPALNNLQTTTYTFTPTSGLCATTTTMTITVNSKSTPTFAQVAPINSGGTLSAFPTTSTNSITGTWSPVVNNLTTTTYTFTPTAGTCAYPAYLTIVVNSVAPNISYAAATQAFTVGSVISQLTPNNAGGAVPNAIYQYVSTIAGTANVTGDADGTGTAASFYQPTGLTIDALANLFVGDKNNYKIRKITSSGVVSTLAGSLTSGATDGIGTAATFSEPTGVSVDASGNVFVADRYNNSIRKITPDGVVGTFVDANAGLTRPSGVAVDAAGNVYVADSNNNKIKK